MHETRSKRISKDCDGDCNRIRNHGFHRFLRKINPHSD
ncbi:hypothetical protein B4U79_07758 [Dinothrombium tinctorium]|uniref:Uncharacterized protein n=1 Tax=Dinothrombium tinctorium TaxID=1965070 RepID=A0A3S3P8B2_9ACAR|nr:hypothetical protein B4U79_08233 [Dinothrombium tinctorium]RWS14392.1 hypothetical protein B4U79_07758 [Dinothrombium tinctorium]